jgi:F-type H+-transporting ATPase subunit epsilon
MRKELGSVMDGMIFLRVVTPNEQLVREDVESIQAPGLEGYLGILPGHAPLLSKLRVGELSYRQGNSTQRLVVTGGILEVLPRQVTVLAKAAERPEDIDLARAESAKQRAEKRLAEKGPDMDLDRATVALDRALIRIQVANRGG